MVQSWHYIHKHVSSGLILQKPQVTSAETAGLVGMGKNAECSLRAVGGVHFACPLSTQLGGHPPDCICLLEKFAVVISSWPSPAFHSADHLQGRSAPFSSLQLAELIYFPSLFAPAHLKKEKKWRWRQIFSIRGKPLNVLARGCPAAVAAPSEILLQFSVHSLGEAGSGE